MLFGNSTQDTRPLFFWSWQKYKQNQLLTPLEQQLVDVMIDHPEYHVLFDLPVSVGINEAQHFSVPLVGEHANVCGVGYENPFLHLGLHLAIRDQIALNRPAGIVTIYQQLLRQHSGVPQVEHLMMAPLAACLWQSNRDQCMPDDVAYLKACKELYQHDGC